MKKRISLISAACTFICVCSGNSQETPVKSNFIYCEFAAVKQTAQGPVLFSTEAQAIPITQFGDGERLEIGPGYFLKVVELRPKYYALVEATRGGLSLEGTVASAESVLLARDPQTGSHTKLICKLE